MTLPHAEAFPLEWRTDSAANASAHLEGPEPALTCHVLQETPGKCKRKRKVTSTDKLFSLKTSLLFAFHFNSLGQKWPRKTYSGFFFFFFFSSDFTAFPISLRSVSCAFLISFSPTFLDSTFILYCHSDIFCIFSLFYVYFFFSSSSFLISFCFSLLRLYCTILFLFSWFSS